MKVSREQPVACRQLSGITGLKKGVYREDFSKRSLNCEYLKKNLERKKNQKKSQKKVWS